MYLTCRGHQGSAGKGWSTCYYRLMMYNLRKRCLFRTRRSERFWSRLFSSGLLQPSLGWSACVFVLCSSPTVQGSQQVFNLPCCQHTVMITALAHPPPCISPSTTLYCHWLAPPWLTLSSQQMVLPLSINGQPAEQVDVFKYLGTELDTPLFLSQHADCRQGIPEFLMSARTFEL